MWVALIIGAYRAMQIMKAATIIAFAVVIVVLLVHYGKKTAPQSFMQQQVAEQAVGKLLSGETMSFTEISFLVLDPTNAPHNVEAWCSQHGITNTDEIQKVLQSVQWSNIEVKLKVPPEVSIAKPAAAS